MGSAMKSLLGSMPTKPPKRTNTRINKRRLRVSATQSLPSCIKLPEDHLEVQEVCPEVCQEDLEVCPVPEDPEQEADLPSKKSTNRSNSNFPPLFFLPIIKLLQKSL